METIDTLKGTLEKLVRPSHRGRLLARGLARGMIWSDGKLPPDSPNFSHQLTVDLLDHGYRLLDAALSLLEITKVANEETDRGLRLAGEAIESAVRKGEIAEASRGCHLVCSSAAFHIAHYSARSYCLLQGELQSLNLSSPERMLCILMRRNLSLLQEECIRWVRDVEHSDNRIASKLSDEEDPFGPDDAVFVALADNFVRALGVFEFGLLQGIPDLVREAGARLRVGLDAAAKSGHVPMWWLTRLARFLVDDLWQQSYHVRLPEMPTGTGGAWNTLRSQFIQLLGSKDLAHVEFWPSQIAAAGRVIDNDDDLVVALPTSSGKTRIAEICILRCLAEGKRAIYVTPLRALSAQVELILASTFRPLGFSTTAVYGASGIAAADVETLKSGNIVVATPEKLDFAIRQDPDVIADVGIIVLDEGHMIGLGEREIRYETLVQRLLQRSDAAERRIVCLSAIFSPGPSFDAFTDWIRSGQPGEAIRSTWRPTRQRRGELVWHGSFARLDYHVDDGNVFVPRFIEPQAARGRRRNAFPQDKNELIVATASRFAIDGKATLVYCPIRKSVEPLAEAFLTAHRQGYFSISLATEHQKRIETAQRVGKEWLGADHPAVKCLEIGVAVHHGQLPRPFLREIEMLLKDRILRVAVSSPTLAQGVDLSFEVLVFSSLWRNQRLIPPMEFANVIGRVGRAHVDIDGIYVLPVFEKRKNKVSARLREFRDLDTQAKHRQMESGILLLLSVMIGVLAKKLDVPREQVAEYVLNNQDAWDKVIEGEDTESKWALAAANELDNAIFSTVSELDCSVDEVATKLDEALKNSYWQKRLRTLGADEQSGQDMLLKSRAKWLWNGTTVEKRRGFFSAGIGFTAGDTIASNAESLGALLTAGEAGVLVGEADAVSTSAVEIAHQLLTVYPFACELPERWEGVIKGWVSGQATSAFANAEEIAFIQDGIVYRLVWAVESIRTTLSAMTALPIEGEGGNFALCLTYGVPNIPAALILQAGLSSRPLAIQLVSQLDLDFASNNGLKVWLTEVANDLVRPTLSADDQQEWDRFVSDIKLSSTQQWNERSESWTVEWEKSSPVEDTPLRVRTRDDQQAIEVISPNLELLGQIPGKTLHKRGRYSCRVVQDTGSVELTYFGP